MQKVNQKVYQKEEDYYNSKIPSWNQATTDEFQSCFDLDQMDEFPSQQDSLCSINLDDQAQKTQNFEKKILQSSENVIEISEKSGKSEISLESQKEFQEYKENNEENNIEYYENLVPKKQYQFSHPRIQSIILEYQFYGDQDILYSEKQKNQLNNNNRKKVKKIPLMFEEKKI